MEKRQISNWRIALWHYLMAGLLAPVLIRFLLHSVFRGNIMDIEDFLGPTFAILIFILICDFLPIWIGVVLSSKYLKKKYVIENKNRMVNLATVYFILLNVFLLSLMTFLFSEFAKIEFATGLPLFFSFLGAGTGTYYALGITLGALVFYILSKKYTRN